MTEQELGNAEILRWLQRLDKGQSDLSSQITRLDFLPRKEWALERLNLESEIRIARQECLDNKKEFAEELARRDKKMNLIFSFMGITVGGPVVAFLIIKGLGGQ